MGLADTTVVLGRAIDGDEAAREEFLERMRPRVVLWAGARMSKKLRSRVEPEDLAQDILLAVHKSLSGFRPPEDGSFLPWFFKIAENRIRDAAEYFDAKKRRRPEALPSRSQTSPSTAFYRQETVQKLIEAIDRLPEDYRRVIRLRRLEEKPDTEVAKILDRSENAVRVLYCRALKALRDELPEAP